MLNGEFRVVNANSAIAPWSSGTSGHDGAHLEVRDTGAAVIVAAEGIVWSTGTTGVGGSGGSSGGGGPTPGCQFTISESFLFVDRFGGTGTIDLAGPGACAWTIDIDSVWLHVSMSSGVGAAQIMLTADAASNTATRLAHVVVGGKRLTILQAADDAAEDEWACVPMPTVPSTMVPCRDRATATPPNSRPTRAQVLDIKANFGSSRDLLGRIMLDWFYISLPSIERRQWRTLKHIQGLTHIVLCPVASYPNYPVPTRDLRLEPATFARYVSEVLDDGLIPIVFLTTGDGGSAADINAYWPGLLEALADKAHT